MLWSVLELKIRNELEPCSLKSLRRIEVAARNAILSAMRSGSNGARPKYFFAKHHSTLFTLQWLEMLHLFNLVAPKLCGKGSRYLEILEIHAQILQHTTSSRCSSVRHCGTLLAGGRKIVRRRICKAVAPDLLWQVINVPRMRRQNYHRVITFSTRPTKRKRRILRDVIVRRKLDTLNVFSTNLTKIFIFSSLPSAKLSILDSIRAFAQRAVSKAFGIFTSIFQYLRKYI